MPMIHSILARLARLFLGCAALVLLSTIIVGCGGDARDAADGAATTSPDTAATRHVTVAAASDLKFALDEIVAAFRTVDPSIEVKVSYGSSGNFFSQLSNGAPFDVFLSADIQYPRNLASAGHADSSSLFHYADGQIVLWAPSGSGVDVKGKGIEALRSPEIGKIAIANPEHAPYGRAAEAAMKSLGVYDAVKDRLVLGENIAQTAQFIESGAADVGIIALSLAMAPSMRDKGTYWPVPLDAYPRLEQGGIILSRAHEPEAAAKLVAYMSGADGRRVLRSYGFIIPGE